MPPTHHPTPHPPTPPVPSPPQVWDVVSNDECARFVLDKVREGCAKPVDLAGEIIDRCFDLQSKDNMSAIVVALPGAPSRTLTPELVASYEAQKAAKEAEKERAAKSGGAGAMAEDGTGSA